MSKTMIIFMVVGLIVSTGILFANDRGIVIDSIATQLSTDAWKLSYLSYLVFLIGGICVNMFIPKRRYTFTEKTINSMTVIMVFVISIFILQNTSLTSNAVIGTDITSIRDEFYEWYTYFGLVIALHIGFDLFIG